MNRRRQALQLCLDSAVVVVQIVNEFLFEVFHGFKILQIQQFALKQSKEILDHSIDQTVAFPAHALPDALFTEHLPVLLVLVLSTLVGMKDQPGVIRDLLECFFQHSRYHTWYWAARDRITNQIKNLREVDDKLKRYIQEDVKTLTDELAETEMLLQKLEDSKRSQMYAVWDIEEIKERLLSFGKYAENAVPDVLVTLIQTFVERIYITDENDECHCHIFIKGCSKEDYDDFFRATGYIENTQETGTVTSILPMCDSDECCNRCVLWNCLGWQPMKSEAEKKQKYLFALMILKNLSGWQRAGNMPMACCKAFKSIIVITNGFSRHSLPPI